MCVGVWHLQGAKVIFDCLKAHSCGWHWFDYSSVCSIHGGSPYKGICKTTWQVYIFTEKLSMPGIYSISIPDTTALEKPGIRYSLSIRIQRVMFWHSPVKSRHIADDCISTIVLNNTIMQKIQNFLRDASSALWTAVPETDKSKQKSVAAMPPAGGRKFHRPCCYPHRARDLAGWRPSGSYVLSCHC